MIKNPYFQFPLCALSFGQTVGARLNAIINYCLIHAGDRMFRKLTAEQQRQFLFGKTVSRANPKGLNPHDWRQCAASYGAYVIGVTYHSFNDLIERNDELQEHIIAFEQAYGRDALVRVKKGWVFNTRDGHGLTYREFSVLCAIYSAIGDKELAIITRERIRRCALGYRTKAIMEAELGRRADKAQPLTERQLRDTITRLHRNKFFARCTVARRITYYSIRLDSEAIRKKVLERRTYASFFHAGQSAQDVALTAALARKKAESTNDPATPPLRAWHPNTPPARN